MAGWPLLPASLREEGAGLPKAQALRSGGLICSSSFATNLHGLPSLSLCLLVHKTGLTVAPHRTVVRAERDGVRGPRCCSKSLAHPSPHPSWGWGQGLPSPNTTPTSICSWAPLKDLLRLGGGSADWGQPGGGGGASEKASVPPLSPKWVSPSLAECPGIRGGRGWLRFRQQSPLSPQLEECLAPPPTLTPIHICYPDPNTPQCSLQGEGPGWALALP